MFRSSTGSDASFSSSTTFLEYKMKLHSRILSLAAVILAMLPASQPQFTIKAEPENKAFDKSCLIETVTKPKSEDMIADCLEHCMQNCLCESFQVCQNKKCQLCSSHKEENSSLLHDKDGCVYVTYEVRHSSETFQEMDDQCVDDGVCSVWYNCCKQPGLCLNNGVCLPPASKTKTIWKRFKCKCTDGFHGDRCERPIKSCDDVYSQLSQESGVYKVVDSSLVSYELYCHFDLDFNVTWTLVQSYSFINTTLISSQLNLIFTTLYENSPLSENALEWRGYRLRKPRMQEIEKNSQFLLFTCNYEKRSHLYWSDYVEMYLPKLDADVLDVNGMLGVLIERGHIGGQYFGNCETWLAQNAHEILHVDMYYGYTGCSGFKTPSISIKSHCDSFHYFGNYRLGYECLDATHRCWESPESTTQLWFGRFLP